MIRLIETVVDFILGNIISRILGLTKILINLLFNIRFKHFDQKMNKNDIVLKIATKDQVGEIYSVMEEVYNRLEDKSLYVCDDLEYVKSHIDNEGFTVIACNNASKIVGSFIFRYPRQSEDNLGRDIGLKEEQLEKVVHMESSVVLPEYRGRGLQLSMLQYGEELIDQSQYKYLMATVSPCLLYTSPSPRD